jgi:hypothetical protein
MAVVSEMSGAKKALRGEPLPEDCWTELHQLRVHRDLGVEKLGNRAPGLGRVRSLLE